MMNITNTYTGSDSNNIYGCNGSSIGGDMSMTYSGAKISNLYGLYSSSYVGGNVALNVSDIELYSYLYGISGSSCNGNLTINYDNIHKPTDYSSPYIYGASSGTALGKPEKPRPDRFLRPVPRIYCL